MEHVSLGGKLLPLLEKCELNSFVSAGNEFILQIMNCKYEGTDVHLCWEEQRRNSLVAEHYF